MTLSPASHLAAMENCSITGESNQAPDRAAEAFKLCPLCDNTLLDFCQRPHPGQIPAVAQRVSASTALPLTL